MRLIQVRPRYLAQLILLSWCLLFALGLFMGCHDEGQASQHLGAPVSGQTLPMTEALHADSHDHNESLAGTQVCQNLSSPIVSSKIGLALLPILSWLLLARPRGMPFMRRYTSNSTALASLTAPDGTGPQVQLLFQRFNN